MDQIIKDNFSIRLIERRDNAQVKNLIVDVMTSFGCVGEGYSSSDAELEDMYAAYAEDRSEFYVVVDEYDKVYGCGGIAALSGSTDNTCELRKMYFYTSIRGLGLGSQLMALLLSQAQSHGYTKCYLETVANMKQARVLYEKFGFEPIHSNIGATGHSGCDNYMIKNISIR